MSNPAMSDDAQSRGFQVHQQRYPLRPQGLGDKLSALLHKLLAGTRVPATWLYPSLQATPSVRAFNGKLSLEIVSHCWNYSHFLAYQLNSLVQNPPNTISVTMTVYYSAEDRDTEALLARFEQHKLQNVSWNWQELPPPYLFRRAIGRNLAAKTSTADWVWFTDCDETFQSGCLDRLGELLQGRTEALLYPAIEYKTAPLTDEDLGLLDASEQLEGPDNSKNQASDNQALVPIELDHFSSSKITRATGPLQITHGDVARAVGYCDCVAVYQKPAEHWCKAHEDRVFRWLLGTQGVAIDLPGVYRIQHQSKGRQKQSSPVRDRIRRWRYQHQRKQGR